MKFIIFITFLQSEFIQILIIPQNLHFYMYQTLEMFIYFGYQFRVLIQEIHKYSNSLTAFIYRNFLQA